MKYLFITEDHYMYTRPTCDKSDIRACDAGVLSVVNISDTDNVTEYYDGDWIAIEARQ